MSSRLQGLALEAYQELQEEENNLKVIIKNYENKLKDPKEPDAIKATAQAEIDKETARLMLVQQNMKELNDAAEKAAQAKFNSALDQIKALGESLNLVWVADSRKFITLQNYYNSDYKLNLVFKQYGMEAIGGMLNVWVNQPGAFDAYNPAQIRLMCERAGLAYEGLQTSFNEQKWGRGRVFNLMQVLRKHWIEILPQVRDLSIAPDDERITYDPLFDEWLWSLCGGKQENIDHIKEYTILKLLYPEDFCDSGGVNPYIKGTPGGNGKGIYVNLLGTMVTPMCVVVSRAKELDDGFNSRQQGKVFNVIDEGDEGTISQSLLKKRTGSDELVVEHKGLEPITIDRTESLIVLDNTGKTIQLKGPGEDRRWSVLETNIVLTDHLIQKFAVSPIEAAEMASHISDIAKDRVQVSRLLNAWALELFRRHQAFYQQHKKLPKLVALHGADYQARLESMKDTISDTFDMLLPIVRSQGIIAFSWVKELVKARLSEGEKMPGDNRLSAKFDEFLKRNGHGTVENVSVRISMYAGNNNLHEQTPLLKCRRIVANASTFDWSLICSEFWTKKIKITAENIALGQDAGDLDSVAQQDPWDSDYE